MEDLQGRLAASEKAAATAKSDMGSAEAEAADLKKRMLQEHPEAQQSQARIDELVAQVRQRDDRLIAMQSRMEEEVRKAKAAEL